MKTLVRRAAIYSVFASLAIVLCLIAVTIFPANTATTHNATLLHSNPVVHTVQYVPPSTTSASTTSTTSIDFIATQYSYTGTYFGRFVSMGRISTNTTILSGATPAGYVKDFHTNNPGYMCLNGMTLSVWGNVRSYADYYVVSNADSGKSGCGGITLLLPQH